jgi:IclR family acetate operon transcriptional repressor
MVSDGWLTRRDGPRPTYTPTMRIVALAAQLAHRTPLVRHATELAGALHARTGDIVHVAVPSYRSALRLVRAAGDPGACAPALRDLAPANSTAAGKLLLAFREPWRDVVLDAPLVSLTDRTLAEPDALRAELSRARERGFATEDGEFRLGVCAVAMPVRAADGEVVAALAASSARVSLAELLEREEEVRLTAADLSGRLAKDAA